MEELVLGVDAETDALEVELPPRVSLKSATEVLARFGDILRIRPAGERPAAEEEEGDFPAKVSVVFFDVRAATRAARSLGCSHRCEVLPQVALRAVSFPRELRMDAFCLGGVSDMWEDPGDGDAFFVEFFDSRDALCVAFRARQQSCLSSWPDPDRDEERWGQPTPLPGDDVAESETASDCGEGPASSPGLDYSTGMLAGHAIVCVQGLPNAICTPSMMRAVLQQAGLAHSVIGGRVRRGTPCGETLVTLSNRQAAEMYTKHFQGHVWDASGTSVSALLVSPPTSWGSSDCPPTPALIEPLARTAEQDGSSAFAAPCAQPESRSRGARRGFWSLADGEDFAVSLERCLSGETWAGKVRGPISDESTDGGSSGCDTQVASLDSRGSRRSMPTGGSSALQFPELPNRNAPALAVPEAASGGTEPCSPSGGGGPSPEWAAAAAAAATENLLELLAWE